MGLFVFFSNLGYAAAIAGTSDIIAQTFENRAVRAVRKKKAGLGCKARKGVRAATGGREQGREGEGEEEAEKGYDWERAQRYAGIAGVAGGTVLFGWYNLILNPLFPGNSPKIVLVKTAVDCTVYGSFSIWMLFTANGRLEGKSQAEVWSKMRQDFAPAFGSQLGIWVPQDLLKFWIIPPAYQVAFGKSFDVFSLVILSYYTNRGVEGEEGGDPKPGPVVELESPIWGSSEEDCSAPEVTPDYSSYDDQFPPTAKSRGFPPRHPMDSDPPMGKPQPPAPAPQPPSPGSVDGGGLEEGGEVEVATLEKKEA